MKKYKQLNYEDRIAIRYGLFKNMSIREISRMLGRSPSTISREIKRGITRRYWILFRKRRDI